MDRSKVFRLIDCQTNVKSLLIKTPDLVNRKFLQIRTIEDLVFYRKVSMFVKYFRGNQYYEITVFKLVPDGDSFRVKIVRNFTLNRNFNFNPPSLNSDLTTVTFSNKSKIEFQGHQFVLVILVSIDLKRIESPHFRLKENLLLRPYTKYHRVTFDDDRRIYFETIIRVSPNEDPEYCLFRSQDLNIPHLLTGLETTLFDFLSLKFDGQTKDNPIQLWEFEIKQTEEDSFEVLENKIG